MTDIVDELRARALQGRFNLEAADEIERLRDDLRDQVGAWIKANAPGGWIDTMRAELAQHRAARIAYASEFDGDVDSIHENIRNLKKERDALAVKVPDEIERLRAELKDRETFIEGYREQSVEDVALYIEKLRTAELERDAMRAELDELKAWKEEAEKQKPVAWLIDWADEPDLGHYFSESAVDEDSGRSRTLFLHPVPAPSVPERITHDQAPHVYSQEAAEGYADGWNACVKEIVAAAPQNCIKAAMEAQREGCAEIVLQAAHKAADCNNLRDYELLRALSIAVAKAPEAKP